MVYTEFCGVGCASPTLVTRAISSPENIPQQSSVMYVQVEGQLLFQS